MWQRILLRIERKYKLWQQPLMMCGGGSALRIGQSLGLSFK